MSIDVNILAEKALSHYPLQFSDLEFIRSNENLVFSVRSGQNRYALRIRRTAEGFITGDTDLVSSIESETAILQRLSKCASFPVQTPIPTRDGALFCMADVNAPAVLLQWLDGEPLGSDPEGKHARALGRLAAEIHTALSGLTVQRPSYSRDRVAAMKLETQNAEKLHHITKRQCSVCLDTLSVIDSVMAELESAPGSKSLIHSDLSLGNVLLTPRGLAPIDFSLSGHGFKAQECGMIASNYSDPAIWREIIEGYGAVSGIAIDPHHLDAFFSMSVLLFITAQHERFHSDDWFGGAMDRWCSTCFKRTIEKGTCA